MNRLNSFDQQADKAIKLRSELIIGKLYKIESNGPYVYDSISTNGLYSFIDINSNTVREITPASLEKLLDSSAIVETKYGTASIITVPDYPELDIFTNSMLVEPTRQLWNRTNLRVHFDRSDLLQLNDLCKLYDLQDLPTPGDPEYMRLLSDERWPLFKRYILHFSPDLQLPEQFA